MVTEALNNNIVGPTTRLTTNVVAGIMERASPLVSTVVHTARDTLIDRYPLPQLDETLAEMREVNQQRLERYSQMKVRYDAQSAELQNHILELDQDTENLKASFSNLNETTTSLCKQAVKRGSIIGLAYGSTYLMGMAVKSYSGEDSVGLVNNSLRFAGAATMSHALYSGWNSEKMHNFSNALWSTLQHMATLTLDTLKISRQLIGCAQTMLADMGQLSEDMRTTADLAHKVLDLTAPEQSRGSNH